MFERTLSFRVTAYVMTCQAHVSISWPPSPWGWDATFSFPHLLPAVSCSVGALTPHCWFLTFLLCLFHLTAWGMATAATEVGLGQTSFILVPLPTSLATSVNLAADRLWTVHFVMTSKWIHSWKLTNFSSGLCSYILQAFLKNTWKFFIHLKIYKLCCWQKHRGCFCSEL